MIQLKKQCYQFAKNASEGAFQSVAGWWRHQPWQTVLMNHDSAVETMLSIRKNAGDNPKKMGVFLLCSKNKHANTT